MIVRLIKDIIQGKPCPSKRSSKWEGVRKNFLKDHSVCSVCGGTNNLEVHHKMPFHLNKDLELDPNNLITLCESSHHCHWTFGHLYDWKSYNSNVEADAAEWNKKIKDKPCVTDNSAV